MKKHKEIGLDFEVDKLTHSIENIATGEIFDTEIVRPGGSGLEKQKSYHSSMPCSLVVMQLILRNLPLITEFELKSSKMMNFETDFNKSIVRI